MRADIVQWMGRGAGLAIGVGSVAVLAFVASRSAGVLLLVFLGALLAAALDPVVDALGRRLRLSRIQAIAVVYVGFFGLVVALLAFVVPAAVDEAERIAERLPVVLDEAIAWSSTLRPEIVGETLGRLLRSAATTVARSSTPPAEGEVVAAGLTVAEVIVTVTTLLVVVAFWLVERPRLQRYVLAFWPQPRRAGGRAAWNRIELRLGQWARGQLILMAAVGVATGVAYHLLGLPSALLLGLIAGLFEVVPLIGPLLGAIPALLVALTISPETAVAVAVVYVLIQFVEGNVLVPVVMRNAVGLSPLLVLLSLLVGAAVGGLVGALVAVPAVAAIEVLLEPLQAREVPVTTDPRAEGEHDEPDEPDAPDAPFEVAARGQA
jgi:predicted PurR-regulated permease PerM